MDDDDELPASPDEGETALVAQLGAHALLAIDVTLKSHNQRRWLKVARVVAEALKAGGFAVWNDSHVHLHVRRVIGLVDSGSLEAKGNLLRPRWSEVRLSEAR
ncbi:MAG TPA: hypothetical protein VGP93_05530 [Polyangiaceae bacterium]|nr:hypothetical protein [Polyangiaceae bacterium]